MKTFEQFVESEPLTKKLQKESISSTFAVKLKKGGPWKEGVQLPWATLSDMAKAINGERDDVSTITTLYGKMNGIHPSKFFVTDMDAKLISSDILEVTIRYEFNDYPDEPKTSVLIIVPE